MTIFAAVQKFLNQPRIRWAAPLLAVGGFALVAVVWVLRVPLLVGLVLAIGIGTMGVVGAVLEAAGRAMLRGRAPIVFRPREPYEFVRYSKGIINLAAITYVHYGSKSAIVFQADEHEFMIEGEEYEQFARLMDSLATPLNMVSHEVAE